MNKTIAFLLGLSLFLISACSQPSHKVVNSKLTEPPQAYDPENFAGLNKTTIPNNSLSKNKLHNPSFEQGTLMWDTLGVGNSKVIDLEHDKNWFAIDDSEAFDGQHSARLQVWDYRDQNHLIKFDQWQQDLIEGLAKNGQEPMIHNPYIASYHTLIKPNTPHTLSFYAKAEYPGQELSVYALPHYRDWSRQKRVILSDTWQRYSMVFESDRPEISIVFGQDYTQPSPKEMPAKSFYWIDAFQLEQGKTPSQFEQKPLAVDLSDTVRRVDVDDKKLIEADIINTRSERLNPTVQLEVQDYFGRTIHKQSVAVGSLKSQQRKSFLVDLSSVEELSSIGFYSLRFEVVADDFYDKEVFRYAVLDPKSVADSKNKNIFGWGAGTAANHVESANLYKDLGFGLYVNNSDNNMSQEFVDLWKTIDAPVLYNVYGRWDKNLQTRKMKKVSPAEMDALVKDVVNNLKRFPDLKYVKIVNEPEHGWKNSFLYDPEQLVPYMKKLYRALKASNPNYVIVSPDLANVFQGNLDWMEKLFRLGGGDAFDIFSIHTYQPTPEEPSLDNSLAKLVEMADRYDFKGDIWLTEGGHYLMETYPPHNKDALRFEGHFESKMPGFTEDFYGEKTGLALGIRTLLTVLKHGERITANTEWVWAALGFNALQKMPRDHAMAYHAMAKRLGNVRFREELTLADTVKAYAFEREDGSISLAAWDYDMKLAKGLRKPRSLIFSGGSVRVEDLFETQLTGTQSAPLTGMPIYFEFDTASEFSRFKDQAYVDFDVSEAISIKTELSSADALTLTLNNQYHKDIAGTLQIEFNGSDSSEALTLADRQSLIKTIPLDADKNQGSLKLALNVRFRDKDGRIIAADDINQTVFLSQQRGSAVKIDGSLADWDTSLAVLIESDAKDLANAAPNHRFDQRAKVLSAWTDTQLFFAFEVADDIHKQSFAKGDMWQEDSVQLFLDTFNDGGKGDVNLEDDYAWLLGKGKEGDQAYMSYVPSWQNAFLTPGLGKSAEIAIQRDEARGVTTYEFAISRANYLPLNLQPNKIIGFGIYINDADKADRENFSYNTGGQAAWMNPKAYPKLLLVE